MLTLLLPEQVASHWEIIKYAIENSLPPMVGEHEDKLTRILESMLAGKTQCWASYISEGEIKKFEGIVVTKFLYDDASDTKNMLIYCLFGYTQVEKKTWLTGIKTLAKYAKSKGCSQIVAYTEYDYIAKLVESLGGEAKYRFLTFNVNEIV